MVIFSILWPENAISEHRSFRLSKQHSTQFRCLEFIYRVVIFLI